MTSHDSERGYLMIEVLITMFILVIGLLGVVGLQARAQQAETDSFQRAQASILLRDIANRIQANRSVAFDTTTSPYVIGTSTFVGTGTSKDCSAPTTTVDVDLCAWSAALVGAAETSGTCNVATGANCVGAMQNARGCITSPAAHTYLIQIAWQGLTAGAAPAASVACGSGSYGTNDDFRRAATTIVQIGDIAAP